MRSWRYYRDLFLYYLIVVLMLVAAVRSLIDPRLWILTAILWWIHNAFRYALAFAHPSRRFSLLLPQEEPDLKDVSFTSHDGLTLSARFKAGRNHATILLAHGLGTSSSDIMPIAKLLMRNGYGVFLMDLRAHGKSQGDTSTFGLLEGDDVACAVDYLLTRLDVHGDQIGAYGVSLGAQAILRGALKTDKLRALILEGLGPSILSDHGGMPKILIRWINYPFNWLYYLVYQFMISGRDQGVLQTIGNIAPRPIFLIASGTRDIYFNRLFFQAAHDPKEIWELPKGTHGFAMAESPDEYVKRMVGFFDQSLGINQEA